ncbi:MAG: hypothetical protein Q9227_006641 [Pyrenula ochraceoflavens]
MLIGICGGICSGKKSIANYLSRTHGFKRLQLLETPSEPPNGLQRIEKTLPPPYHEPKLEEAVILKDPDTDSTQIGFYSIGALVEYATKRWQEHFVMTDVRDQNSLDLLLRRPFFLFLYVDAPLLLRWKRYNDQCAAKQAAPFPLNDFVEASDEELYYPSSSFHNNGLANLADQAQVVRIFNGSESLTSLHSTLGDLNLTNQQRLRPSWDQYFMELASLAAQRSNCMKRRVGCVLVRERRVISTGYNGTPRNIKNCNEGGCKRCNGGHGAGVALSTCLCLHAEENALLEAGRDRIREGSILYCDTCPCLTCSVKITQVGISEVVYAQGYNMDKETAEVLKEGGVRLRQFSLPPRSGLVGVPAKG